MNVNVKTGIIVGIFLLNAILIKSQPIPVEIAFGDKYGSVNLVFNKNFSPGSKFGFFHMNTVQFYYKEKSMNSFLLQDLLYFEPVQHLKVAGGVAYSKGGFNPTAGLQFIRNWKRLMILAAPRVNIESDPTYDLMTIIQYKQDLNDRMKIFSRVQMLNFFGSEGNIKSYQWFRLGLEFKEIQFGAAVNLDEYGPNPSVDTNLGLFVRKEILSVCQ